MVEVIYYQFKGEKLPQELASQLDESRVTGISGTEGVIVHTDQGMYFVQAYNSGQRVLRKDMNETLRGLLESDTRDFLSKYTTNRFEISTSLDDLI